MGGIVICRQFVSPFKEIALLLARFCARKECSSLVLVVFRHATTHSRCTAATHNVVWYISYVVVVVVVVVMRCVVVIVRIIAVVVIVGVVVVVVVYWRSGVSPWRLIIRRLFRFRFWFRFRLRSIIPCLIHNVVAVAVGTSVLPSRRLRSTTTTTT